MDAPSTAADGGRWVLRADPPLGCAAYLLQIPKGMTTPKALFLLLCLLSSACINLPDIDDSVPEPPTPDGGVDGGIPDGGADQTPPTLVRATPPHGSTRVPIDSTVELEYSEAMAESSLQLSSVPAASFTLESWTAESKRAVFRPSVPLAQDQQYALTAEGKDLAGNPLAGNHSFAFTTVGTAPDTTAPILVDFSPAIGAFGVPKNTPFRLTFSEPMNQASVERAFSIVSPAGISAGTTTWNASGTEVEFIPATSLPYGTDITWTLSSEAKDLADNTVGSSMFGFRVIRMSTVDLGTDTSSVLASPASAVRTSPWTIGDDSSNRPVHGFASFSLQSLSTQRATQVTSAILSWPYVDPGSGLFNALGRFAVEPVNYGTFINSAYITPSVGAPLLLNYQDFGVQSGNTQISVTTMVADAWVDRASRSDRVQFRLKFETGTNNNNTADSLTLSPDNLSLRVSFEHP